MIDTYVTDRIHYKNIHSIFKVFIITLIFISSIRFMKNLGHVGPHVESGQS